MIRTFADLCCDLERAASDVVVGMLLDTFVQGASSSDVETAMALLRGERTYRICSPRQFADDVCKETGLPPWLLDTSRRHGGTLVDTAVMMLPPSTAADTADEVGLQLLATMQRSSLIAMLMRCTPSERIVIARIATGLRPARFDFPTQDMPPMSEEGMVTLMTTLLYAHRSDRTTSRTYSHLTVGVYKGTVLVPVARIANTLTDDENRHLDEIVSRRGLERFGPTIWVSSGTIIEIRYTKAVASARTKSGIKLINATVVQLHANHGMDAVGSVPGTL